MNQLTKVAILVATACTMTSGLARAVSPTPDEMAIARQWAAKLDDAAGKSGDGPLFSFTYRGKPAAELLPLWKCIATSRRLDDQRIERTTVWTDPKSGLEVRRVSVEYADFPVIEWTVYFKNTGKADTPILSNIQGMDVSLRRDGAGGYTLHSMHGDDCSPQSYQPLEFPINKETNLRFAAVGGRPTNGTASPYFNVEWPGQGVIAVLGWPGQWAAQFTCDKSGKLAIRGGQELTNLKLRPGEQIRTPLSVLMFWRGDFLRSQNIWRQWMLAHNVPRVNGRLPQPFNAICMGLQQSEATERAGIDSYVDNGVVHDYWWMDAGWYPCRGQWQNTGTWEPDKTRFPRGLRAVSDYAHRKGLKMVLWFEPERCAPDTWLTQNRPQWIFGGAQGGLLYLGNPETRQWLTDHVDRLLKQQAIDLYREDHNFDPLPYWREHDAPDRQGITENLHVQGHLAYWDDLRRRNPNIFIDTCASGGRRNDLESLRRALPLLRSDFHSPGDSSIPQMQIGNQGHTYGISLWIPFFGAGEYYNDRYAFRSHMAPHTGVGYKPGDPIDWPALKKTIADWRSVAPNYYGDYYPLTKYSLADNDWIAWQFNRSETGTGMIQAFRREKCPQESIHLKLHGLDPNAVYVLTDLDKPGATELTGRELADPGLPIAIKNQRDSVIIKYKKK